MAMSEIVRAFIESLAKKVDMTPAEATSTYSAKVAKISEEDPRLLQLYDEYDIGNAIYNSRTGDSSLGIVDPARFLDMASYLPVDRKNYEFIRETIENKKQDISQGIPREQYTFPSLGLRLDPEDNSLFVNLHDGRHINTAMKEMGYPKGLVEFPKQYKTPDLKTLPSDTPVYSEAGSVDGFEIPRKKVGTLDELIKFLMVPVATTTGALSALPSGENGDKVVE